MSISRRSTPLPVFIGRLILLVALIFAISSVSDNRALARVSKKFLKGFLLGAYMAKHHEPIVVHMDSHYR